MADALRAPLAPPSLSVPPGTSHAAFGLGVATAAGGAFGYARTGSLRSLGAGAILGGMFVFAGYKISQGDAVKGFRLAALNGLALAVIMGVRFAKTRKVMPAGLLSGVGVGAAAYYGKLYYDFTAD